MAMSAVSHSYLAAEHCGSELFTRSFQVSGYPCCITLVPGPRTSQHRVSCCPPPAEATCSGRVTLLDKRLRSTEMTTEDFRCDLTGKAKVEEEP